MILALSVAALYHHEAILQTDPYANYMIELALVAQLYHNQRRAKVWA